MKKYMYYIDVENATFDKKYSWWQKWQHGYEIWYEEMKKLTDRIKFLINEKDFIGVEDFCYEHHIGYKKRENGVVESCCSDCKNYKKKKKYKKA